MTAHRADLIHTRDAHLRVIGQGYVGLNGDEARLFSLADDINRAMPAHVLSLVSDALNDLGLALNGARILVLGAACAA